MTGHVAVVTGGTRGIGESISMTLKKEGYRVVATYRGDEKTAKEFSKQHGIPVYKFDVSDFKECEEACAKIESEVGPIAILINNAGITRDGFLHKMEPDAWNEVIRTNLTSCFNMCRAVITGMRNRGYGRIVNISSINGVKGQLGQTNYAAAKAGIIGFSKSLAQESAIKNITVNVICPGYVETDMTAAMDQKMLDSIIAQIPAGRMAKPDEISDSVLYLVSAKAGFVNGTTVHVNGGQYMV